MISSGTDVLTCGTGAGRILFPTVPFNGELNRATVCGSAANRVDDKLALRRFLTYGSNSTCDSSVSLPGLEKLILEECWKKITKRRTKENETGQTHRVAGVGAFQHVHQIYQKDNESISQLGGSRAPDQIQLC